MKNILITGADGCLGGKLSRFLADQTDYGVISVGRDRERICRMIDREKIQHEEKVIIMTSEEMFSSDLTIMNVAGAVHLAFSRAIFPNKDIASSLDYSLRAFNKVIDSNIENAVYISSQSIYGGTIEWRTVGVTDPAPNSVYAMAKYAGEKIFEACYKDSNLQHTILRLDNVIQSQNLVRALCRSAKEEGVLRLKGGKQVFSYIDADDFPPAILALLNTRKEWSPVYNVGPDKIRYTLVDIANVVCQVAKEKGIDVSVELEEDETALWAGMDTGSFIQDTGWRAECNLKDMVKKIFTYSVRKER